MFTTREAIAADQHRLTWRDSVRPVVLVVAGTAIVHYAFSYFVFEPLIGTFNFGIPNPMPIVSANTAEVAIVAVIAVVILAAKARNRLMAWNYWIPAAIVALCSLSISLAALSREAKREEVARQYDAEVNELKIRMQDPKFLVNLKLPLSSASKDAVTAALGHGERVAGIPLTSTEVHAILTNLGSDPVLETCVAASPATSVEDLQWLAVNGRNSARLSVAKNPHSSHETLLRLMDDPDFGIRYVTGSSVAEHGCDSEIIRIFWDRESSRNLPRGSASFRALAGNPCTPKDILSKLTDSPGDVGKQARTSLHALSTKTSAGEKPH